MSRDNFWSIKIGFVLQQTVLPSIIVYNCIIIIFHCIGSADRYSLLLMVLYNEYLLSQGGKILCRQSPVLLKPWIGVFINQQHHCTTYKRKELVFNPKSCEIVLSFPLGFWIPGVPCSLSGRSRSESSVLKLQYTENCGKFSERNQDHLESLNTFFPMSFCNFHHFSSDSFSGTFNF